MQEFFGFVRSLGAARLVAMGAEPAALIGLFSFLMLQMTAPQMVPLFTDLSVEDSSSMIKDLERQAVPYQMTDGAIIMVARDRVARLRMKLAEGGLPKGGGIGYEIFDKTAALGATTLIQNINHMRALEGELTRTIRSVQAALGGGAVANNAALPAPGSVLAGEKTHGAVSIIRSWLHRRPA